METVEFIEELHNLNLEHDTDGENILVFDPNKTGKYIAIVPTKEFGQFKIDYSNFYDEEKGRELLELLYSYSTTRVEKREKHYLYLYKGRAVDIQKDDKLYLNYDTGIGRFFFGPYWYKKAKFTHSELEEYGIDREELLKEYIEIEEQ